MKTDYVWKSMTAAARIACAAMVLVGAGAADARAQSYVTGSANTDGFSLIGYVHDLGAGLSSGHFKIIVHRDEPENGMAAAICEYSRFTNVVVRGNRASFRSLGSCVGLTTAGGWFRFASDNVFGIVDNGEPGAGADTIDVNFLGAGGVAVPGSLLVNGNFIVHP
jgi:hypothetical protein